MKGSWAKLAVPAFCAVIALTACNTNGNQTKTQSKTAPVRIQSDTSYMNGGRGSGEHINSIKVIPRYSGDKRNTTNEYGTTYSGMGSGIYSRIGTSSLHDTPESKTLEDRLASAGLTGVTVLTLGDSIYIGDPEQHTHMRNSKPQPHKVLSPHEGSSGKGYMSQKGTGYSIGNRDIKETNLSLIYQEVTGVYGKNAKIYTVHDPKGIQAIEKVKTAMRAGTPVNKLNKDWALIKKNAELQPVKLNGTKQTGR